MRKPLIAALGLVSLVALADLASARDLSMPHPTEVDFSHDKLKSGCNSAGGTFTEGGAVTRGYRCNYVGGVVLECNKAGKCQTWTNGAVTSKTGAATTAGAAANQKKQ